MTPPPIPPNLGPVPIDPIWCKLIQKYHSSAMLQQKWISLDINDSYTRGQLSKLLTEEHWNWFEHEILAKNGDEKLKFLPINPMLEFGSKPNPDGQQLPQNAPSPNHSTGSTRTTPSLLSDSADSGYHEQQSEAPSSSTNTNNQENQPASHFVGGAPANNGVPQYNQQIQWNMAAYPNGYPPNGFVPPFVPPQEFARHQAMMQIQMKHQNAGYRPMPMQNYPANYNHGGPTISNETARPQGLVNQEHGPGEHLNNNDQSAKLASKFNPAAPEFVPRNKQSTQEANSTPSEESVRNQHNTNTAAGTSNQAALVPPGLVPLVPPGLAPLVPPGLAPLVPPGLAPLVPPGLVSSDVPSQVSSHCQSEDCDANKKLIEGQTIISESQPLVEESAPKDGFGTQEANDVVTVKPPGLEKIVMPMVKLDVTANLTPKSDEYKKVSTNNIVPNKDSKVATVSKINVKSLVLEKETTVSLKTAVAKSTVVETSVEAVTSALTTKKSEKIQNLPVCKTKEQDESPAKATLTFSEVVIKNEVVKIQHKKESSDRNSSGVKKSENLPVPTAKPSSAPQVSKPPEDEPVKAPQKKGITAMIPNTVASKAKKVPEKKVDSKEATASEPLPDQVSEMKVENNEAPLSPVPTSSQNAPEPQPEELPRRKVIKKNARPVKSTRKNKVVTAVIPNTLASKANNLPKRKVNKKETTPVKINLEPQLDEASEKKAEDNESPLSPAPTSFQNAPEPQPEKLPPREVIKKDVPPVKSTKKNKVVPDIIPNTVASKAKNLSKKNVDNKETNPSEPVPAQVSVKKTEDNESPVSPVPTSSQNAPEPQPEELPREENIKKDVPPVKSTKKNKVVTAIPNTVASKAKNLSKKKVDNKETTPSEPLPAQVSGKKAEDNEAPLSPVLTSSQNAPEPQPEELPREENIKKDVPPVKSTKKNKKKAAKGKNGKNAGKQSAKPEENLDELLNQFAEIDAQNTGIMRLFPETSAPKKKRTISQVRRENEASTSGIVDEHGFTLADYEKLDRQNMVNEDAWKASLKIGFEQFKEDLDYSVANQQPLEYWPDCPLFDGCEHPDLTADRRERVTSFLRAQMKEINKRMRGNLPLMLADLYFKLVHDYSDNLGAVIEPFVELEERGLLARDDKIKLLAKIVNVRECKHLDDTILPAFRLE